MSDSITPAKSSGTPSASKARTNRVYLKTPYHGEDKNEFETQENNLSPNKEILHEKILPKIISLAARLLPTVSKEMEGNVSYIEDYNDVGSIANFKTNNNRNEGMNQSKHNDPDDWYDRASLEFSTPIQSNAHEHYDEESGLRLPRAVARAALTESLDSEESRRVLDWGFSPVSPLASTRLPPPSPTPSRQTHIFHSPPPSPSMSVENIAAGLGLEYQLKQMEADELLASIHKSHTSSARKRQFSKKNKPDFAPSPPFVPFCDDDGENDSDEEADDDDDLEKEILRLNDVAASLRTEMQDIRFESLPVFERSREDQNHQQSPHTWRIPALPRSPFSLSRSEDAALRLKTFRTYFGTSGSYRDELREEGYITDDSIRALYWALAVVWAVVILLAGHFEFKGMQSWGDVLDWLFQFGI